MFSSATSTDVRAAQLTQTPVRQQNTNSRFHLHHQRPVAKRAQAPPGRGGMPSLATSQAHIHHHYSRGSSIGAYAPATLGTAPPTLPPPSAAGLYVTTQPTKQAATLAQVTTADRWARMCVAGGVGCFTCVNESAKSRISLQEIGSQSVRMRQPPLVQHPPQPQPPIPICRRTVCNQTAKKTGSHPSTGDNSNPVGP